MGDLLFAFWISMCIVYAEGIGEELFNGILRRKVHCE